MFSEMLKKKNMLLLYLYINNGKFLKALFVRGKETKKEYLNNVKLTSKGT